MTDLSRSKDIFLSWFIYFLYLPLCGWHVHPWRTFLGLRRLQVAWATRSLAACEEPQSPSTGRTTNEQRTKKRILPTNVSEPRIFSTNMSYVQSSSYAGSSHFLVWQWFLGHPASAVAPYKVLQMRLFYLIYSAACPHWSATKSNSWNAFDLEISILLPNSQTWFLTIGIRPKYFYLDVFT